MDEHLLPVIDAASSAVGVDFRLYREGMLRRRIAHRMRLRGCEQLAAYEQLLRSDAAERWRLADAFLIKTTSAFRDQRTWEALHRVVLPKLLAKCVRRGSTSLSTWVAGCSTGEEAYSYAIAMLDARDRAGVHLDVRVYATDVDASALEHAARGVYSAAAFANAPEPLSQRYLRVLGDGKIAIVDDARAVVSLSRRSLIDGDAKPLAAAVFASFDVVSCCNVMLYFDDAARRAAFARLIASCETGGVLVLGEAEFPPPELQRSLKAVASSAHAYEVMR